MWPRPSVQRQCSAAIVLVLLCYGCGRSDPPARVLAESERNAIQELTPVAQEFFSAAARHDTARLKRVVSDTAVVPRALWLATHQRRLTVDASKGLDSVDAPVVVTPDSCYIVFLPKGHRRNRDLLAMWFKRTGADWKVDFIGFQEPRHRTR
jgi:hypothetical protein